MQRPLDRAAEDQGFDLVDAALRRHGLERAGEAGRHLAQHHQHCVLAQIGGSAVDQRADRRQVAGRLVVGGHVGGDVDNVAAPQRRRIGGEREARGVLGDQLRQARLDYRQLPGFETLDHRRVGVVADHLKPARGGGGGRIDAEMGHPGKAHDRTAHLKSPVIAAGLYLPPPPML